MFLRSQCEAYMHVCDGDVVMKLRVGHVSCLTYVD